MTREPLPELSLDNINYALQKVTEAIAFKDNLALARASFPDVRKRFDKEKKALASRHGEPALHAPGLSHAIDNIDYTINKIESWLLRDEVYQNRDAYVFIDCLVFRINKLKDILSQ